MGTTSDPQKTMLFARVSLVFFSVIFILAMMTSSTGCGGGGDTYVTSPTTTIIQDDKVEAWRLQLTDMNFIPGGRPIYEDMPYSEKIVTVYSDEVRHLRFQLQGLIDGKWFLYAGLDTSRLDIRCVGTDSGVDTPMLASAAPRDSSITNTLLWDVIPYSGNGKLNYVAEVYDRSDGVLCYMHFSLNLISIPSPHTGGDTNPNHAPIITVHSPEPIQINLYIGDEPVEFSLSGYDPDQDVLTKWWKFDGGSWASSETYVFHPNQVGSWTLWGKISDGSLEAKHSWTITVQPMGPPPPETYYLKVFGTLGEFTQGGSLYIDEGNGALLSHWELWPEDGTGDKIILDPCTVEFESSILPFWVWDSERAEVMTVLWDNPEYPNANDPGNIFINPGSYDVCFTVSHGGVEYRRSGHLAVVDRLDFP